MIVDGRYSFAAPRETVYALLQDPEVLVKALPGAQALQRIGGDRFEGVMAVGVGPVTAGEFSIHVELHEQRPPEGFSMRMEGKGTMGFVKGAATIVLTEEAGVTVMVYTADLKIGGKIASVGQRLLDSVSKAMTKQGLEAVNRELQQKLDAHAPQAPHTPPGPDRPTVRQTSAPDSRPAPSMRSKVGGPRVVIAALAVIIVLLVGVCRGLG